MGFIVYIIHPILSYSIETNTSKIINLQEMRKLYPEKQAEMINHLSNNEQQYKSNFVVLIESNGFWTVIGIILGILFTEGITQWKNYKKIRDIKLLIIDELNAMVFQIQTRKEFVEDMHNKISSMKYSQMYFVPFSKINCFVYDTYISELYRHITINERNCLFAIYSIVKNYDNQLLRYFNEIESYPDLATMVIQISKYKLNLLNILKGYDAVHEIIKKYINKEDIDVFAINGNE